MAWGEALWAGLGGGSGGQAAALGFPSLVVPRRDGELGGGKGALVGSMSLQEAQSPSRTKNDWASAQP